MRFWFLFGILAAGLMLPMAAGERACAEDLSRNTAVP